MAEKRFFVINTGYYVGEFVLLVHSEAEAREAEIRARVSEIVASRF